MSEFVHPFAKRAARTFQVRTLDSLALRVLALMCRSGSYRTGETFIPASKLQKLFGHDYKRGIDELVARKWITLVSKQSFDATDKTKKGKCITYRILRWVERDISGVDLNPEQCPQTALYLKTRQEHVGTSTAAPRLSVGTGGDGRYYSETTQEADNPTDWTYDNSNILWVAVATLLKQTGEGKRLKHFNDFHQMVIDGTLYDTFSEKLDIDRDIVKQALAIAANFPGRSVVFGTRVVSETGTYILQSPEQRLMSVVWRTFKAAFPGVAIRVRRWACKVDSVCTNGSGKCENKSRLFQLYTNFETVLRDNVYPQLESEFGYSLYFKGKHDGGSTRTEAHMNRLLEVLGDVLMKNGLSLSVKVKSPDGVETKITYGDITRVPSDIWSHPRQKDSGARYWMIKLMNRIRDEANKLWNAEEAPTSSPTKRTIDDDQTAPWETHAIDRVG